jgi:Ca2+-binding RTX toxin-like protein
VLSSMHDRSVVPNPAAAIRALAGPATASRRWSARALRLRRAIISTARTQATTYMHTKGTTLYGRGSGDYVEAGPGVDYIDGSWGNDTLIGGDDDEIYGGEGNDQCYGGSGTDTFDGCEKWVQ